MSLVLLALLSSAFGADIEQKLEWDLVVDGKRVGSRSLTVRYLPADGGMRRIMESLTELDAGATGIPYTFKQRLTAHAGDDPAAFTSVVSDNGAGREIQGRGAVTGWTVTITEKGRSRTWEKTPAEIHLSTADLLDPETRVPLSGFDTASILSVETGAVLTGAVGRLGASELTIDATPVPVYGLAWDGPTGRSTFYYTSEGVLVRYETDLFGKRVQATLKQAPPPGVDDVPVSVGSSIGETEL